MGKKTAALLVMLALVVPFAMAQITTRQPGKITVINVTDPAYGAVADAELASDCDTTGVVPLGCTTPGTGTDNEPFFTAAIAAAVAAGIEEVIVPCGDYRIGTPGETMWNNAALIQGSNVWLHGQGTCSRLLPGGDVGSILIAACDDLGGSNCPTPGTLDNIRVTDFWFYDDDPLAHGCSTCEVAAISGLTGTFIYMEPLSFSGTSPAGTAYFWGAFNSDARMVYTFETASTDKCASGGCSGTITGDYSGATATITSIVSEPTVEEAHGVIFADVRNGEITRNRFDFFGDEALVLSKDTIAWAHHNFFWHNPGGPSGGSSINIQQSSGSRVESNIIFGGVGHGVGGGSVGIYIEALSGLTIDDPAVLFNQIIEPSDDLNNHLSIENAIYINAAVGTVNRAMLAMNSIDLDIDETGVCTGHCDGAETTTWCDGDEDCSGTCVLTDVCDEDSDCPAQADTPLGEYCGSHNRGCAGSVLECGAIVTADGSNNITGLIEMGNMITGGIEAEATGAGGAVIVMGNALTGSYDKAMIVDGENIAVIGNVASGHGKEGLMIGPQVAESTVVATGNILTDLGAELTSTTALLGTFSAASAGVMIATSNAILGKDVPGGTVRGLECDAEQNSIASNNYLFDCDDSCLINCGVVTSSIIEDAASRSVHQTMLGSVVANNRSIDPTAQHILVTDDNNVVDANYLEGDNGAAIDESSANYNTFTDNVAVETGGGASGGAFTIGGAQSVDDNNTVRVP